MLQARVQDRFVLGIQDDCVDAPSPCRPVKLSPDRAPIHGLENALVCSYVDMVRLRTGYDNIKHPTPLQVLLPTAPTILRDVQAEAIRSHVEPTRIVGGYGHRKDPDIRAPPVEAHP